jgi:hypothetical protein
MGAAWQQSINMAEPLGLGDLASGIASLASAADTTLGVAEDALAAAQVFLGGAGAPQAAAAQALVGAAEVLVNDLFGVGFYQVFAHPWQHGVGRGEGLFRTLSFPNCTAAIVGSFDDQGDPERPQFSALAPLELIALIAGGPSPAIFATVLDAFNALIDSKEFRLAARRLAQAIELDATRYTIATGSRLPDWQSVTLREAFPALNSMEDALRDNLAMLKGYAAGADNALDIAADLIAAKRAQLQTLQSRLAAATALFGQGLNGAGVYALHVTGAPGSAGLKAALAGATGAPGPELSFCAGVCWVGVEGTLTGVREVLAV